MTAVAIIPARGGSRRLPRKNMLPVAGHPMLHYPVQAALKSRLFDQVIVSSEDAQIIDLAARAGARVMERPAELASDRATVAQVCEQVLGILADEGVAADWFCCVYATAVFITPLDLRAAFKVIQDHSETDGVMGVSRFNLNPFQALMHQGPYLTPVWPSQYHRPSQAQPGVMASNGMFYWMHTRTFLKEKTFYPERLRPYEIPWIRAVDVNTPGDYDMLLVLAPWILKMAPVSGRQP